MRCHHIELHIATLFLGVANEVFLGVVIVVAFVHDGDHGARGDGTRGARFDDFHIVAVEQVFEVTNAAFHVALLVFRGVVVAVLAEVAQ